MSSSKKSKSKSKRSSLGYRDLSEDSYSSHKDERRSVKSPSEYSKQERSDSSEKMKKDVNSPQIKSLVKVPLPSLLTPFPLVPTGNNSNSLMKAKVVHNKSGMDRGGSAVKSLMDLQFEDRSLGMSGYRNERRTDRKPGLLPEPCDLLQQNHANMKRKLFPPEFDINREEELVWFSGGPQIKKVRRAWTESEAVSSHSLFNSSYKPLVIESEPLRKVGKMQKSPKPLLDTKKSPMPLLETQKSPKPLLDSQASRKTSRSMSDDGSQHPVLHSHKIIELNTKNKNSVYLVIPSTLTWIHLHGKAKITVIKGVVTILAHNLTPGNTYEVYSPSTNCLLSLQVDPATTMSPDEVKDEMQQIISNSNELKAVSGKSSGIIKVEKLDSWLCDYVTSFPPFTKLFTTSQTGGSKKNLSTGVSFFNGSLKVAHETQMMGLPCMAWNDHYNEALDKWLETIDKGGCGDQSPVFVCSGARNTGKSLFNRCVVNTTLRSVPEVAYLDCDVGQTEFSPPATISLHIIRKPVLSPPFCHQRHAEKMVFYGDVTPVHDPSAYVQCIHHVIQTYKELALGKKLPLIVNTMGFPDGVGFMLLIDLLNMTRPDLVVQFESDQLYGNLPPISQEMIALDEGWTFNKCPPPDVKERVSQVKEHVLLMLPTLNKNEKNVASYKLHPTDFRNLAMFSSLSLGLGDTETLLGLTPCTVPYRNLAIHVHNHRVAVDEVLIAIDAGVVALCEADLTQAKRHKGDLPMIFDDMPICDCLGLGLVRAVDMDKGLLYISTTLPRHLLKRVNTLLKGSLALPEQFIMKQQNTSDYAVPYIDSLTQSTGTGGLRVRSRMPRIHKRPNRLV